jgi:hypothetical protein
MAQSPDRFSYGDRWLSRHEAKGGDKWIKPALGGEAEKGKLHRALHIPLGETIPVADLKARQRKGGPLGRRAGAVLNANPDHGKD